MLVRNGPTPRVGQEADRDRSGQEQRVYHEDGHTEDAHADDVSEFGYVPYERVTKVENTHAWVLTEVRG